MPIHPTVDLLIGGSRWLEGAQLPAAGAKACIAAGLQRPGLFTGYLRELSMGDVSVSLIYQGPASSEIQAAQPLIRRDVVISVGEHVAAVASTIVEASVVAEHPWLNELGSSPIGETLELKTGAVRTDIHYCAIDDDDPLLSNFSEHLNASFNRPVINPWGRQYRYIFDGEALSITEVISGHILALIGELPLRR